jgi:hypothetical protein
VVVAAEYPEDFVGVFTINYAAMKYLSRNGQLNSLDGAKARMDIGREELRVFNQGAEDAPAISKKSQFGFNRATDLHVANFLECIRSRTTPAALVVQMANLSMRQGRRIRWNAAAQRVAPA